MQKQRDTEPRKVIYQGSKKIIHLRYFFYGKASRKLHYMGWLIIPTYFYAAMITVPF
jgi:hypothetical protein